MVSVLRDCSSPILGGGGAHVIGGRRGDLIKGGREVEEMGMEGGDGCVGEELKRGSQQRGRVEGGVGVDFDFSWEHPKRGLNEKFIMCSAC
jgi:hypothetical protein